MKKVYTLSKEELDKEDREFRKTAYGKKLWNCHVGVIVTLVLVFIIYLFNGIVTNDEGFASVIKDAAYWMIILIGGIAEEFSRFKYNVELKEYINNSK